MTLKPWIVGLVLVAAAGSASAQTGLGARQYDKLFVVPAKPGAPDPKLFTNTQAEQKAREALAAAMASAGARNSCGMTPGLARSLRPDSTGSMKRIVPPPTCK
jgi:hypothetical protein